MVREKVDFVIDNGKIVEFFGVQNFAKADNAILELVKNSYDAKAKTVIVKFEDDQISIIDDGEGMDAQTIKDYWMHVGKSDKTYNVVMSDNETRVLAGSKGIGRFALARLGSRVKVISRSEKQKPILWETDWNEHYLSYIDNDVPQGTTIVINNTKDRWNEKTVHKLASFLNKCKKYDGFDIIVDCFGEIIKTSSPFDDIEVGKNCIVKFDIGYDCNKKILTIDLISDEFSDDVQKIVDDNHITSGLNIHHLRKDFDAKKLLSKNDYDEEEFDKLLTGVGSFIATFYFNNLYVKADGEINKYKRPTSLPSFNKDDEIGVVLYRNAFCIAGYDGTVDWLGFGKRSRSSPAAPSHPTGTWRVRENQICGEIFIDKLENKLIQEMQNRQGITNDAYFMIFKDLILEGIKVFENYRQSIIRSIRRIDLDEDEEHKKKVESFIKKPSSVLAMSDKEINSLAFSVASERDRFKKNEQRLSEEIKNARYDVRLLNTLATIGLKSSWKAHDLYSEKRTIISSPGYIIDALKEYGFWDILSDSEHTKLESSNVPFLLNKMINLNLKIATFIDSTLETIEKRKFKSKLNNPFIIVRDLCNKWENDYTWIDFEINVDDSSFEIPDDVIETILNNLILNSVQQNKDSFNTINPLKIRIDCVCFDEYIDISYHDFGVGLHPSFQGDERKILQPHVTTRKNGHGLGMWIVNNTAEASGGSVIDIKGDNGFYIKVRLGKNSNGYK